MNTKWLASYLEENGRQSESARLGHSLLVRFLELLRNLFELLGPLIIRHPLPLPQHPKAKDEEEYRARVVCVDSRNESTGGRQRCVRVSEMNREHMRLELYPNTLEQHKDRPCTCTVPIQTERAPEKKIKKRERERSHAYKHSNIQRGIMVFGCPAHVASIRTLQSGRRRLKAPSSQRAH